VKHSLNIPSKDGNGLEFLQRIRTPVGRALVTVELTFEKRVGKLTMHTHEGIARFVEHPYFEVAGFDGVEVAVSALFDGYNLQASPFLFQKRSRITSNNSGSSTGMSHTQ